MWAATALPVRRLKVSRQATTALPPSFVTVALKEPFARRTFPFGFGRSFAAVSVVVTLATAET
jgi:hypothetical protein